LTAIRGKRFFSSQQHPDWFWNPSSLLSNAYWRLFPQKVKQVRLEADYSPSSAKVENGGAIPTLRLHGVVLN
jgi:hypothetical protein